MVAWAADRAPQAATRRAGDRRAELAQNQPARLPSPDAAAAAAAGSKADRAIELETAVSALAVCAK